MCVASIRLQIPCCPQVGLRQLLRRLEREKGEVEWQLKECEWRLDQEATVSGGGSGGGSWGWEWGWEWRLDQEATVSGGGNRGT